MSLTTCTIHATQRAERAVYVSGELARALRLNGAKNVRVHLGSASVTAPLRLVKKAGNHLYLPLSLVTALKLPRTGQCSAISAGRGEMRIGPLVGVLASAFNNKTAPFGTLTSFMKQIMEIGKDASTLPFVFTPRDVRWQNGTVVGYFLQPSGSWIRKTVPLPDVVYNRLPSRQADQGISLNSFKQRFVKRGIPLFNWSFFDKWDVYDLLRNDEAFQHVPESHLNPSAEQIRNMLEKHRFIYLKPTGGSLGIGIYRLTYTPKRGYFARYRQNGKNVLIRFDKFESLMRMLGTGKGRLNHYVAQQGIRLIEIDSCPIDFRFHMTKNGNNRWVVAAIGAKKAGKGSVTTHVRSGGMLMTPEQVMRQVYGARGEQILQKAKDTAIRLAEAIERHHHHRLGELGFDIGIDSSERIWMFEANAKPGRSIFKHPSLKSADYQSLANIFDYCLHASQFKARRDS
ncbi:YheC/YheD family protein [Paenibacillus chartarius]|uniref:YheC/YheD family protein n=1 Tax=Paenibacillus chartarius TaxID=747481 RepID=A0ABV6DNB5_9BACL